MAKRAIITYRSNFSTLPLVSSSFRHPSRAMRRKAKSQACQLVPLPTINGCHTVCSADQGRPLSDIRGEKISSPRPPRTYGLQMCFGIYRPVVVRGGCWENILAQTHHTPVVCALPPHQDNHWPAPGRDRCRRILKTTSNLMLRYRGVAERGVCCRHQRSGAAIHCGRLVIACAACRRPPKVATLLIDDCTPTRAP
jgi:hypothetical protein